jgi:hypothetical protein
MSTATYTATITITVNWNQWSWSQFGKAAAMGAVTGAISGGLGDLGAGGTLGNWGNTLGFDIFRQSSSTVATNVMFGNDLSGGMILGSLAGGLIGGVMPQFTAFSDNTYLNAIGDISYSTLKGSFTGAWSGLVTGAVDRGNMVKHIEQGFIGGGISGGVSSTLFNIEFGRSQLLTKKQLNASQSHGKFKSNAPLKKTGGLFFIFGNNRGITLGTDISVGKYEKNLIKHETAHSYQINKEGFATFYGRTIGDYIKSIFGDNPYEVSGHYEYAANNYAGLVQVDGVLRRTYSYNNPMYEVKY